MTSIPAIVHRAAQNDLKPSIGRVSRFTARWSCSTMLLRSLQLPHDNGGLVHRVIVLNRCRVAATLIDGDFLRQALGTNGLV